MQDLISQIFSLTSIILLLIFLEGVLSIDNAAVLGAMVAHLPKDEPIAWPRWLQGFAPRLNRSLGMQQTAALKVGLLGAYLGRGLMLFLANLIADNAGVLLVGAIYLMWLAINHFAGLHTASKDDDEEHGLRIKKHGFWVTVLMIELADLAFSLDNVVVAVSLDKRFWVIAIGVGIGIVVMRFAASIFTHLIQWEPNLEHAAFVLLLAIGTETLVKIYLHLETPHYLKFGISMVILLLTIALSRVTWLAWLRRALRLLLPVAHAIQAVVKLLWTPIGWLFKMLLAPFVRRVRASEAE